MTWAVLLDRDGVLDEPVWDAADGRRESPLRAQDVVLVPGAAAAARALIAAGAQLAVVSNQPAAAKGKATQAALWEVHERVAELLEAESVVVDVWHYCFHRAEDGCDCRKPRPAMLLDAAEDLGADLERSWMVGDSDGDIAAGRAAGCRTVLVEHPASAHRRGAVEPDFRAPDLAGAVKAILTNR